MINFWSTKITTLKSAFKAFSFNKVSDIALIFATCVTLTLGSGSIQETIEYFTYNDQQMVINLFGYSFTKNIFILSLIIAAFCKSAQIGFHFWLPDSMEAPVPASALIHSATLVSAGIYLMLRFSCILHSSIFIDSYSLITAFTAFYGAFVAANQTDVKKILAYSTISHCGVLMFSVVFLNPYFSIFYLFVHGFFKSLSFMCVGNLIQYAGNYQDVSKMGGMGRIYIFELLLLVICLLNLSGLPLCISFFSKN